MKYTTLDGKLLKEMIINGAYELENNKDYINELNVFPVPDGDTGTNMAATIMAATKEIREAEDTVKSVMSAVSMGSLMGARGNSGVILSQILRGIAKKLKESEEIDTDVFAEALNEGVSTAYRAVMKPTEGTILTVAKESAEEAILYASETADFEEFLLKVYNKAEETLSRTPDMLPALKEAGVVDAGGKGLCLIYLGMLKRLQGIIISSEENNEIRNKSTINPPVSQKDIKFLYCTEFFIKTDSKNTNRFKSEILNIGDSLVVVGEENLIKVHIHTNDPGEVLHKAVEFGELSKIKIDNMKEQHESIIDEKKEREEQNEYSIIAVAAGDGMIEILKDLGAEIIIEGGQTMNPSTQDLLEAIESVNARNIFIYPNNKNIIMTAQQVKDLTDKNVIVIPTRSIPESITSILTFNPEVDIETNTLEMNESIKAVKTGQITYAVRDTTFNNVGVKEGNYIAIANGELTSSGENILEVMKKLIDSMVKEDSEIVTLYYGNDVTKEDAGEVEKYILEKYEDAEVNIYYGGQPIYYYIISVE